MTRDELRRWAKTTRAGMEAGARHQADDAIVAHLQRLLESRWPHGLRSANGVPQTANEHGWIAAYAPFGSEPQAVRQWSEARAWDGVCLPVVTGRTMRFYRCPTGPAQIGAWGIPEPAVRAGREVPADKMLAVLVPGLVFAANGDRLGYGGGYYDRWFDASPTQAIRIGICYDWQRVEHVPSAEHDHPLDFIVTETGCWPATRDTPRSE